MSEAGLNIKRLRVAVSLIVKVIESEIDALKRLDLVSLLRNIFFE